MRKQSTRSPSLRFLSCLYPPSVGSQVSKADCALFDLRADANFVPFQVRPARYSTFLPFDSQCGGNLDGFVKRSRPRLREPVFCMNWNQNTWRYPLRQSGDRINHNLAFA